MSEPLVIYRDDGTVRRVAGYVREGAGSEGRAFESKALPEGELPGRVDLRPMLTPVEDQEQLECAAACAVAGAYEWLLKRGGSTERYDASRLFVYYNARELRTREGAPLDDDGCNLAEAIEALRRHGACAERSWPFDPEAVNEAPSDEAFDEAAAVRVTHAERVARDVDAWRKALAEGRPVLFGLEVFPSFDQQRALGLLGPPTPVEREKGAHAGHAMLCVGYSDRDRLFVLRNSWGVDWGDEGYCYMPYACVADRRFHDGDAWVLRADGDEAADMRGWSEDATPMVADSGPLRTMTEESWVALLDALGERGLEVRVAQLLLHAARAELAESSEPMLGMAPIAGSVFAALGRRQDAMRVLARTRTLADDEAMAGETIRVLGAHLPADALALLVQAMTSVQGPEGDDDDALALEAAEAWKVGAGFESVDESGELAIDDFSREHRRDSDALAELGDEAWLEDDLASSDE